jgi:hypothetical protein
MALAMGEGGEQNAPLGRAVIGGLLIASFYTLLVVPTLYVTVRRKDPKQEIELPEATPTARDKKKKPDDQENPGGHGAGATPEPRHA